MTLLERLRRLLDVPEQLDRMETRLMSNLDALQAAAERNGSAVRDAVTSLADLRQKVAVLTREVAEGDADDARIAAIAASIDASSDAIAQALAPVVEDEQTDTGAVDAPPAENPDTPDPESVDGSVAAGEPLPA